MKKLLLLTSGLALPLISTVSLTLATPALSQEALGAHEHGAGQLELVKIGGAAEAHFHVTSLDMVGFGAPASETQEQAVADMLAAMQVSGALIKTPEAAACSQSVLGADYHVIADDHDDHDEHGDEDHKDEHDEHAEEAAGHAEFEILIAIDCANAAAFTEMTLTAFGLSASLEHLELEAVIDGESTTAEIEADSPLINL